MAEESISSNRRIQLLRERLELYNATIAEAMGVIAGVTSVEKSATHTTKSNTKNYSTSATTAQHQVVQSEKLHDDKAPRLERDLAADFSAAQAVDSELWRYEKSTTQQPPPPPAPSPSEELDRENVVTSMFSSMTPSDDDDDSDTLSSECDPTSFVNPYLNRRLNGDEFEVLVREGLPADEEPMVQADTMASIRNLIIKDSSGGIRESDSNAIASSFPTTSMQLSDAIVGNSREENCRKELPPPFAMLETAYYRLTMAEQAVYKLRESIDIERFPRSLPQRKQAIILAESRDGLVKKEQTLRNRESDESVLNFIFESDVLSVDRQVQELLAECETAKALFTRVHERRAFIAEKGGSLKRKLKELEDIQREVQEKRQALTALQQRNEQREVSLIQREEIYKKDLAQHKEREQILQEKIDEVEALSQKVSSWMKILEDRDTKLALKEQRLRRVQSDLVRRSEELLSYRGGRAKQQSRLPQQRTGSP